MAAIESPGPAAQISGESWLIVLTILPAVRHETANEIRDFIGGCVQREVPRIKDVNLSLWNVAAVRLWLSQIKRQIVFSPHHQQARLGPLHPGLPPRIGIHIGAVVVEQIALDVSFTGLVQERAFVGPEIGIVQFRMRITSDVPGAGGFK